MKHKTSQRLEQISYAIEKYLVKPGKERQNWRELLQASELNDWNKIK